MRPRNAIAFVALLLVLTSCSTAVLLRQLTNFPVGHRLFIPKDAYEGGR